MLLYSNPSHLLLDRDRRRLDLDLLRLFLLSRSSSSSAVNPRSSGVNPSTSSEEGSMPNKSSSGIFSISLVDNDERFDMLGGLSRRFGEDVRIPVRMNSLLLIGTC